MSDGNGCTRIQPPIRIATTGILAIGSCARDRTHAHGFLRSRKVDLGAACRNGVDMTGVRHRWTVAVITAVLSALSMISPCTAQISVRRARSLPCAAWRRLCMTRQGHSSPR